MTEQNPKRRKLENSGFEYTVSVSNDTQQLNTIERNTNQLGHMIVALNARLDTYSTKTTEQTLKMDTILHKIAKLETNIDSLMIKNTQLVYQLENVKKELSDLQIHMLHGQNMAIDTSYDTNTNIPDNSSFSYCA